jgi:hypothetical protein
MNVHLQDTVLAFSHPGPDFNQRAGQHTLQSQATSKRHELTLRAAGANLVPLMPITIRNIK